VRLVLSRKNFSRPARFFLYFSAGPKFQPRLRLWSDPLCCAAKAPSALFFFQKKKLTFFLFHGNKVYLFLLINFSPNKFNVCSLNSLKLWLEQKTFCSYFNNFLFQRNKFDLFEKKTINFYFGKNIWCQVKNIYVSLEQTSFYSLCLTCLLRNEPDLFQITAPKLISATEATSAINPILVTRVTSNRTRQEEEWL